MLKLADLVETITKLGQEWIEKAIDVAVSDKVKAALEAAKTEWQKDEKAVSTEELTMAVTDLFENNGKFRRLFASAVEDEVENQIPDISDVASEVMDHLDLSDDIERGVEHYIAYNHDMPDADQIQERVYEGLHDYVQGACASFWQDAARLLLQKGGIDESQAFRDLVSDMVADCFKEDGLKVVNGQIRRTRHLSLTMRAGDNGEIARVEWAITNPRAVGSDPVVTDHKPERDGDSWERLAKQRNLATTIHRVVKNLKPDSWEILG